MLLAAADTPSAGAPLEQILIAYGFGEKLHRSGFHYLNRQRNVAMTGDENDRKINAHLR